MSRKVNCTVNNTSWNLPDGFLIIKSPVGGSVKIKYCFFKFLLEYQQEIITRAFNLSNIEGENLPVEYSLEEMSLLLKISKL